MLNAHLLHLDMKNHHSQEQKWVSLVLEGNCRDDITLDIIHELPSRLLFLCKLNILCMHLFLNGE